MQSKRSDPAAVVITEPSVRIVSIEVVPANGLHVVRVSFIGQAGRQYHLLFAPDLMKAGGAGWDSVESMEGTGGLDVMSHEVDTSAGFYRTEEATP